MRQVAVLPLLLHQQCRARAGAVGENPKRGRARPAKTGAQPAQRQRLKLALATASKVDFDPADDPFPLNRLPKDKNVPLIMYCDGSFCWKSYKSAIMAMKAGWKNIYGFRGGYPEWKEAEFAIAKKD
jgi:rhodanese-related sulfurtransferase